jgi:hypothetical protein
MWAQWLNGTQREPPTPEEASRSAEDWQKRRDTGKEWDAKDEEMMKKWRRPMNKRSQKNPSEPFQPESWSPNKRDR